MENSVSDRENEQARKSAEVYPEILERVRKQEDLLHIADDIANRVNIDRTTAYRWVYIVDTKFQRRRRIIAGIGAAFVWVCGLSLAGGVVLLLLQPTVDVAGVSAYVLLFVAAAVTLVPAIYISLRADALVFRRRSPFEDED